MLASHGENVKPIISIDLLFCIECFDRDVLVGIRKTLFLCRYLHSEELRREINGGLYVVEQWNGATDFVRFARRGDF